MSNPIGIALSGLNTATLRVTTAATNIANEESGAAAPSAGAAYSGYTPQDVVAIASDGGVTSSVQARSPAYRLAANPDGSGEVAVLNVDTTTEMIGLDQAKLAYGADAKLIRAADQMQKTAIDLLG